MTTPRIVRVFPRQTKATPSDALAYFGPPDRLAEADEVHVSVTFTYDKPWAEHLAEKWRHVAPVKIGGVAYGDRGDEFVPGRYIKPGYVFTSRGCPRRCWFCSVWKRDPVPRLLPIIDGWNILDDNLLACPRDHVEAVFAMLRRQNRRIEFTGGLEALALQDYQVELLASLRPRPTMFWAYDPGDEFETLRSAARRLLEAGFTAASHLMRVYVLIGYPEGHVRGCRAALAADASIGFTPMAMLWRPETPSQMKWTPEESWKRFQRLWARPGIIHAQEALPYGRSPGRRARVKAARAAQRDDARDRANLRPAHKHIDRDVYTDKRNVHIRPSGNSRAAFLRRLRKARPRMKGNNMIVPATTKTDGGELHITFPGERWSEDASENRRRHPQSVGTRLPRSEVHRALSYLKDVRPPVLGFAHLARRTIRPRNDHDFANEIYQYAGPPISLPIRI